MGNFLKSFINSVAKTLFHKITTGKSKHKHQMELLMRMHQPHPLSRMALLYKPRCMLTTSQRQRISPWREPLYTKLFMLIWYSYIDIKILIWDMLEIGRAHV